MEGFDAFMDQYGDAYSGGSRGGQAAADNFESLFDGTNSAPPNAFGSSGGGRAPVGIKNEADSFIGSDGSGLSDYIQREQSSTHRSLGADLDDVDKKMQNEIDTNAGLDAARTAAGNEFDDMLDAAGEGEADPVVEETDMGIDMRGSKRSVWNPKRYTQGKYEDHEGAFGIDGEGDDDYTDDESDSELTETEDSESELSFSETRAEGVVKSGGDNRVIEPLDGVGYDDSSSAVDSLLEDGVADLHGQEVAQLEFPNYDGRMSAGADPRGFWQRGIDKINAGGRKVAGMFKGSSKRGGLSEPLLGTEMSDLSGVLPFKDKPSVSELSQLGGPDLGEPVISKPALSAIIKGMEDKGMGPAAISQEIGIGMSSGGGMWISRATLGQYLAKQGKGLMMSPLIGVLVNGLNAVHDGVGDMVSLGMIGADLLMTGDPLGILAYGVAQLYDAAAESRQKVIDNDKPDKDYGTKMGYVREGDTWYPAVFNQRYKSTGLWRVRATSGP